MSAKWHRFRERALKSLTSSMGRTSTFGSSRWRWCWPPWTFGNRQRVRGGSTIRCGPQSHQGVPTTREEGHVHHWHQLGGYSTSPHQEVQGTRGGVEHTLQHPLHSPQVLHVQDARGRGPSRPHQQGQGHLRINLLAWRCP